MAGRLADNLKLFIPAHKLFMDVDSIKPGVRFRETIRSSVGASDFLLVLITHEWIGARSDSGQLRLHDPEDFVRLEVEQAIALNKKIIPVLIEGADMPNSSTLPNSISELAALQAVDLSNRHFRRDILNVREALGIGAPAQDAGFTKVVESHTITHLLFNFDGQLDRTRYWLVYFAMYLVTLLLYFMIDNQMRSMSVDDQSGNFASAFALVPLLWPHLAITVKRAREFGRGWDVGGVFAAVSVLSLTLSLFGQHQWAMYAAAFTAGVSIIVGAIPKIQR